MAAPLFDLSGKNALVTGASGGIGISIVTELAKAGAKIYITAQTDREVSETISSLMDEGIEVGGSACDLSDDDAVGRLAQRADDFLCGIDFLVCNAGITGAAGPFASMGLENFDSVMQLNLRSMIALTQAVLPNMSERGGGSVVLMSSIAGLRGNSTINAYALSKAGVAQLARNLAVEWGPKNIRINTISPGLIRTPLSKPLLDDNEFMARRMQMTPLRRVGEPNEVAGAVLFLSSAAGAFVNGHNLVVDGGTTITDGS